MLICVSEPATSALPHGVPPSRDSPLRLSRDPAGVLRTEVHVSGDAHPVLRARRGGCADPGADEREGGRGLFPVDALADRWDAGERAPGKVVRCEFAPR